MSDDQDVNELRAKLEQKDAQFESYKQQCKHIEQMLEEECQKKQQEIKQLKEEAIKRQKGQKMLKAQVSQLQAEVNNLKSQVGQSSKSQDKDKAHKEEIQRFSEENLSLKSKNTELENKVQQLSSKTLNLQGELTQANKNVQSLTKSLTEAENKAKTATLSPPPQHHGTSPSKDSSKTQEQLKKLKQKLSTIQKQKSKLQKLLKDKEQQNERLKHDHEQKFRKLQDSHSKSKKEEQKPSKRELSQHKQPKEVIALAEHKLQMNKQRQIIHQLQQKVQKFEHVDRQQKQKLINIMNEKTALLQKLKKLSQQLDREKEKRQETSQHESPQKTSSQQIMIEDASNHQADQKDFSQLRMDCLLLTKKHYISPFIEIKENRLIKVYKSTKNGFEKSLGATRHKFDSVGYDSEATVQTGVEFAKDSIEKGLSHSIVIYGSKRTSKKHVMASIIQGLKEWIFQKIDEHAGISEEDQQPTNQVNCLYMKHSVDSDVHEQKSANNKEEISQILDEIISMNNPTSPSKKPLKKNQKPKVRYFSLTLTQGLSLQIMTTSYLNPFVKNNETFIDYLNAIVFSKLPNILQSSNTNYHIITLINPIVNEYEECKNTLSITMVPFGPVESSGQGDEPMTSTLVYSPMGFNKEDLNDVTKKKLESFEKETEQAGIKVRKIEEECTYFRTRFEELEVRLKNLINTHQQQNTYLKKSPVTLSYEKLLKFVNSVLARNSSAGRGNISPNFGQTQYEDYHQSQNQVNMYIEEDAKSLDGY